MKLVIVEGVRPTLMPEGPAIEREVVGAGVDVEWYGLIRPDQYAAALGQADAVITRPGTPFSAEMVRALKKARVVVSLGVGYDHIALDAAAEMEIPIANVPDYGTEEVADSTLAMLLVHSRKLGAYRDRCANGSPDWDWRIHMPVTGAAAMQAGIIGFGRIGKAVAGRLKGFGDKVVFYDPYLEQGIEKDFGVGRVDDLESLLRSSDIVSIHTPLTDETRAMVDDRFFRLLKPAAILLNTARGAIFKSADVLYRALREMPGLRIGADVWPEEPPKDHPLLDAWKRREAWLGDRLIITPHAAFYSDQSIRRMRAAAAAIVKETLKGSGPYNIVNRLVAKR
jgi:D-3-phosphoglycerate dehydrogenase